MHFLGEAEEEFKGGTDFLPAAEVLGGQLPFAVLGKKVSVGLAVLTPGGIDKAGV